MHGIDRAGERSLAASGYLPIALRHDFLRVSPAAHYTSNDISGEYQSR